MALSFWRTHFIFLTVVFTAIIVIATLLAIAVPHWMVISDPDQGSFGFFNNCRMMENCERNDWPDTIVSDGGNCVRDGDALEARLLAAGIIMAVACLPALVLFAMLFITVWKNDRLEGGRWMGVVVGSIVTAILALVSLVLFSASVNNWLYCGTSFCRANGLDECGFSFSFVIAIVAIVLSLLSLIVAYLAKRRDDVHLKETRQPVDTTVTSTDVTTTTTTNPNGQTTQQTVVVHTEERSRTLLWIAMVLAFFALVCTILACGTPSWVAWETDRSTVGLWESCNGDQCTQNKYPGGRFGSPTCNHSVNTLKARRDAVAAFLFLAMFFAFGMWVFYFLRYLNALRVIVDDRVRAANLIVIGSALVFEVIAIIVFGHTYNHWLNCDNTFCNGRDGCGFGFSFAACLLAIFVLFILFLMHLFEYNAWACYKEGPSDNAVIGYFHTTAEAQAQTNVHHNHPNATVVTDTRHA